MAVELKVRIEDHSGCELPIDVINADATIAQLAGRVLKQMTAAREPAPAAAAAMQGSEAHRADCRTAPAQRSRRHCSISCARDSCQPLTAAALMPWPITLFEHAGVSPGDVLSSTCRAASRSI